MANTKSRGTEMAEKMADFVNVMTHEKEDFVNGVTSEHRFLQQEMFNAMFKCIEKWSEAKDNGRFDTRNEYAVKASKAMIEGLKQAGLY